MGGKKKLTQLIPEEAQMRLNKDFKLTLLNILKELKETNDKELKEIRKMYERIGNMSK